VSQIVEAMSCRVSSLAGRRFVRTSVGSVAPAVMPRYWVESLQATWYPFFHSASSIDDLICHVGHWIDVFGMVVLGGRESAG
jgi:hypothetical protein